MVHPSGRGFARLGLLALFAGCRPPPIESYPLRCRASRLRTSDFAESSTDNGISLIIAGAGGAAHLPGMVASKSRVPVLGVPIPTKYLNGQDSLYSIVQMPKGIPVATFAIGEAGATNAALFAISIFAQEDNDLLEKLKKFRIEQEEKVKAMKLD